MMRILLACFLLFSLVAQTAAPGLADIHIDQNLNRQIPLNLTFKDDSGQSLPLGALQTGKPIVLVLVQYNCPSLCTAMLNDMLSTLKVIPQNIGSDYDVWTISFDPQETAALATEKKHAYLASYLRTRPAAHNATDGWHFLTGDQPNIDALTAALGYHYRYDPASHQFIHPAALLLLTPDAKISRYFFGIDYDPTDFRLSLVEASNGRIGTLTDKVLLLCYHYDPSTGKYTLAITNLLRVAAALTVILLAVGLGILWRRDQRRTRRLLAQAQGAAP